MAEAAGGVWGAKTPQPNVGGSGDAGAPSSKNSMAESQFLVQKKRREQLGGCHVYLSISVGCVIVVILLTKGILSISFPNK
jgi:hypothetical protein